MSEELSFERRMVERIFRRTQVDKTPALETLLLQLVGSAREGHLCISMKETTSLPSALWSLGKEGEFFPKTPLVFQEDRLYLQRNWALESLIVRKATELTSRAPSSDRLLFNAAFSRIKPSLQPGQIEAIEKAFDQTLAVFTGGPGTGKTYTAGCFIRLLAEACSKASFKVAIAAPTGKAASHLEMSLRGQGPLPSQLQCESTTLHRLLRLRPGVQRFFSEYTIDADLVVVDEASMLDLSLTLHLLNAIGPDTRLLLLGDPHQLPPIEAGSLFAEMANLFGHRLERSLRLGDSELLALAEAIQRGNVDRVLETPLETMPFTPRETLITQLCAHLPSPIYPKEPDPVMCLQEHSRFRILSALRQGPLGVDALNRELIHQFESKLRASEWLAIPILITHNDEKRQLYNGTAGVLIRQAFRDEAMAYFSSGDKIRVFAERTLPQYEAAFCLSVHKSQGSEFEEVLILFPPGSERFGKEALYTAVTRAKRKAKLVGDPATFRGALVAPTDKRSGFTERFLSIRRSGQ